MDEEKFPEQVILEAKMMLESITNPLLVGDTQEVDGYWIETHTIGCRNAADEPEEDWWSSHWEIYDEYDSDGKSLILGDPEDGKFVTITPQLPRLTGSYLPASM